MRPYFADDWLTIYQGDARDVLPTLPGDSVDCIVTSPPYWGLRDYGKDGQLGLEATPELYVANLVAVFRELRQVLKPSGTCWLNLGSSYASGDIGPSQSRQRQRAPAYDSGGTGPSGSTAPGSAYLDLCDGCRVGFLSRHPRSAGNSQPLAPAEPLPSLIGRDSELLGSEPVPLGASSLAAQVSTRPQSEPPLPGSCSHCDNCGACLSVLRSSERDARLCVRNSWLKYPTFKPKDLVPIPWMVAMALQADGWYLRSDIIWSKPNPMPESVTDRPTKAHEYLFLLTKAARYFYDADAVREAHSRDWSGGRSGGTLGPNGAKRLAVTDPADPNFRNGHSQWEREAYPEPNPAGRNLRSVWTIATRPYPGAHFAVFPPELPERCIKAGSSERGVCPECGAPWERVVERANGYEPSVGRAPATVYTGSARKTPQSAPRGPDKSFGNPAFSTTGWRPTCSHDGKGHRWTWIGVERDANGVPLDDVLEFTGCGRCGALRETEEPCPPRSAVILDPFAGSGTTGMVANRLSRRAILIDLNADYLRQQMARNAQTPLGLGA